jgi:hypothetical protein
MAMVRNQRFFPMMIAVYCFLGFVGLIGLVMAGRQRHAIPWDEARSYDPHKSELKSKIGYILTASALLLGVAVNVYSQFSTNKKPVEIPVVQKTEPPPPPPELTWEEKITRASTYDEMWSICKPLMRNAKWYGESNDISNTGHHCFAQWADAHVSEELGRQILGDKKDTSSPSLVFKNSEKELGKRICLTGEVLQIKEVPNHLTEGLVRSDSGFTYHYVNLGNSKRLLPHVQASMCGIVVGYVWYRTTENTFYQAVDLMGVWYKIVDVEGPTPLTYDQKVFLIKKAIQDNTSR